MNLSTCPWTWSDPSVVSHPYSCHRRLLDRDTLLFPQSHHVFLLGLIHNTYLDHVILIDIHVVIKNDAGKVIRIVPPKYIERFSPMKPFSLS